MHTAFIIIGALVVIGVACFIWWKALKAGLQAVYRELFH